MHSLLVCSKIKLFIEIKKNLDYLGIFYLQNLSPAVLYYIQYKLYIEKQ